MIDKKTGGPAFPCKFGVKDNGMTLRDYFAAKAMAGICGHRDTWGFPSSQAISKQAYDIADSMLEARDK